MRLTNAMTAPCAETPPVEERGRRFDKAPRIGLALSSGLARGWAHIGVLRTLEQAGIRPSVIAGTSIGALVGGAFMAGKLDALEEWARALTTLRILRYVDFSFARTSLIAAPRVIELLHHHLGDVCIDSLPGAFTAVATDIMDGQEVWLRNGSLAQALHASFALPGVLAPVRIKGRWLVDGALVNPIPVSACRAMGADMVIAVNLNATGIGGPAALRRLERAARVEAIAEPGMQSKEALTLFGIMSQALTIMQDRMSRARLAGDPPDITIAPALAHVSVIDFHRAAESIDEGAAATVRAMPFLQDALTA